MLKKHKLFKTVPLPKGKGNVFNNSIAFFQRFTCVLYAFLTAFSTWYTMLLFVFEAFSTKWPQCGIKQNRMVKKSRSH